MAHQVNPAGFRPGKTFLWNSNEVFNSVNTQLGIKKTVNLAQGLDNTLNQILNRSNLLVVKSAANVVNSGKINVNVLYYSLVSPIKRNRAFPVYTAPRVLLSKPSNYNSAFKTVVSKFWASKLQEFNNRFVRSKIKKNLNKLVTKSMFYGAKSFLGSKKFMSSTFANTSIHLKQKHRNYSTRKTKWYRWRVSKKMLNEHSLSKQLSKRTGLRVQLKLQNVFTYLSKKSKKITFKKHQRHIWNKRYHYNKKRFTSYFDIVNSLYLLCNVEGTEHLVLKMIQYGLLNMHRRKIRPKNMFYFLNSLVKNMKSIQKNFNAFRLIITGKLRGGTSRTQSFSTGFGILPKQTLNKNINYVFGDVRSKYGSFGVKVLTWRKSLHETQTDAAVKWTLLQQRRSSRRLKTKLYQSKHKCKKKIFKLLRVKFPRLRRK